MSYMEQQMQSQYESYNHLEEQNYYEELAIEHNKLREALKDTLSKISNSHPELLLKYGVLVDNQSDEMICHVM